MTRADAPGSIQSWVTRLASSCFSAEWRASSNPAIISMRVTKATGHTAGMIPVAAGPDSAVEWIGGFDGGSHESVIVGLLRPV